MSGFPRAALGSLGNRAVPSAMAWALAGYLTRRGVPVRHFHSRACYCSLEGALPTTGSRSRHLDSWLMSRDLCRTLLADAYASADFVLVEGRFAAGDAEEAGTLDVLCRQLDLPRIIVLDAALAADCRIPPRPDAVDGVLVDGLLAADQFARIQTCIEGSWGVPVVGGIERNEPVRQRLSSLPPGAVVPKEVCDELVDSFSKFVDWKALTAATDRTSVPRVTPSSETAAAELAGSKATIAVAYDEAFCGYFPDLLEMLERRGARVVDFSPLADETLPEHTDVVLLGCGRPDLFAERLAANFCMHSALHDFVRRGGRIYSEGGGAAYLGRSLRSADGHDYSMANLLPIAASRAHEPAPPTPSEFVVGADNWLLPRGATLRGYHTRAWNFRLVDALEILHGSPDVPTLFQCGHVIGGALQMHLAASPTSMAALVEPAHAAAGHSAGIG